MSIYPFIEAEKACRRNVKRACELLKVSRAAFNQHLAGPSAREQQDGELAAEIQAVHEESKGRYAAPRVHAQLTRRGHRHSRKRVARLMRRAGLQGRAAKRFKRTTIADPAAAARADKVRRDFTADAARVNEVWSMTAVLNEPSQAVMRRPGLTEVARFDHPGVPDGHPPQPHVTYDRPQPRAS